MILFIPSWAMGKEREGEERTGKGNEAQDTARHIRARCTAAIKVEEVDVEDVEEVGQVEEEADSSLISSHLRLIVQSIDLAGCGPDSLSGRRIGPHHLVQLGCSAFPSRGSFRIPHTRLAG